MKDRVPLYPGRVKLTPVSGKENTYDMVRADEPTQEGTPLSKATFLKDATAALYGLGADAVPDDVLASVGNAVWPYTKYWWRRRTVTEGFFPSLGAVKWVRVAYASSLTRDCEVKISANVNISEVGTVSLANPTVIYVRPDGTNLSMLRGQYFTSSLTGSSDTVFYAALDAAMESGTKSGSSYYCYIQASPVFSKKDQYGEWQLLNSSDAGEYPQSGISGGYQYEYLGIPFDNAAVPLRIETGSYFGTGQYGEANLNQITFGFRPSVVIISSKSDYSGDAVYFWGSNYFQVNYSNESSTCLATSGANVMEWYNKTSDELQLNISGCEYGYIAIG